MCTICTRVQICTREQIYTRVQFCNPLCRVHMPINCVHTHQDLIRHLTQSIFMRNLLSLNVLNGSNAVLSRCMCLGEGVWSGASSIFRRRSVWVKLSHSIHIKAKSEKHIQYSICMIVFHSMPSLNQTNHFYSTHWL